MRAISNPIGFISGLHRLRHARGWRSGGQPGVDHDRLVRAEIARLLLRPAAGQALEDDDRLLAFVEVERQGGTRIRTP